MRPSPWRARRSPVGVGARELNERPSLSILPGIGDGSITQRRVSEVNSEEVQLRWTAR